MNGKINIKVILSLLVLFVVLNKSASAQDVGLFIHLNGKDSLFNLQSAHLKTRFTTFSQARTYLENLPSLLASEGFASASIDSVWEHEGSLHANLFPGRYYEWYRLNTSVADQEALASAGYRDRDFFFRPLNISRLDELQNKLIQYYSDRGYPFAAVFLDSIRLENDKVYGRLRTDRGRFYVIDSISISGSVKISNRYLQRHLQLPPGSAFSQSVIREVDKRLAEVPFLLPEQPSTLTMLGKGSILNVYLKPRRSNQVNVLLGLMPAAGIEEKPQLTGDVLLDLKNIFGGGQSLLFKWQQLQRKSPRVNLGFEYPYIAGSSLGLDFYFDLFRKDSSFLLVNTQVGLGYMSRDNLNGKLFLQWQSNSLLQGGVDTGLVRASRKLPPNADVSALNLGAKLQLTRLDYLMNPRKGYDVSCNLAAGTKRILRNSQVTDLKGGTFDFGSLYDSVQLRSYQLRVGLKAALFLPIGKSGTFRSSVQSGWFQSPDIFRNELFQIGGFRTIRGFDEESIYATQYGILTLEYRYLLGVNAHILCFLDGAYNRSKFQEVDIHNRLLGVGLGSLLETGAGMLSLTYAAGFRDDVRFDIRRASKLHVGYVHYF